MLHAAAAAAAAPAQVSCSCRCFCDQYAPIPGHVALALRGSTLGPAAHARLPFHAQVKAILVNIFGGIMRCDVIASGIVNAAKQVGRRGPCLWPRCVVQ